MNRTAVLVLSLLSLFGGCATVQPVHPPQVVATCPRIPALPPLDLETQVALDRDYSKTMASFLQGLLPMPTEYGLHSAPAALPTSGLKLK